MIGHVDTPQGRQPAPAPRASWWARCWAWLSGYDQPTITDPEPTGEVERPWRYRWDHLPRRSAGFGFTSRDYQQARHRAEEVARTTLGDAVWSQLRRDGYLDVSSGMYPGVTYRLRVGRRIEVRTDPGVKNPWPYSYLCINPAYPLPELEFFAQLYLYVRDQEEEILRVAAPQPWDQELGRTF
jgi:hypothetical protein